VSLRSERDKAVLEAEFAYDKLNGFAAELEHQVSIVMIFLLRI
jgi:nucleoprotein TPR